MVKLLQIILLFLMTAWSGIASAQEESVQIRTIKAVPLDQSEIHARLEEGDIYRWTSHAVEQALTFGMDNWQPRLEASSIYFSPSGWADFIRWFHGGHTVTVIEVNQQSVTAKIDSIRKWRDSNGKTEIYPEALVTMTFKGPQRQYDAKWFVKLTIQSRETDLGLYPEITSWEAMLAESKGSE